MSTLLTSPLPPIEEIVFGKTFAPNFVTAEYKDGRWTELRLEPLHLLSLHPATVVFHYGQAIFEGLKAFKRADGQVRLFRPELNAQRFARSAERLLLPPLSEADFIDATMQVVQSNYEYVPDRPGSLYLRPTMIGSEAQIGVRGSKEALFFLIGVPAGAYFRESQQGLKAIDIFVDESLARAARGGTGDVKAAANYAVTLKSIDRAKKLGCAQVLYLDSFNRGLIEEMGGMNIFFVIDGELVTPPLSGMILPGITRASAMEAAATLGITVQERPISIHEIKDACHTKRLTEAFACGTAATIVGINSFLFEHDSPLVVPDPKPGPVTERLLAYIQDIQYGVTPDPHNWMLPVPTNYRTADHPNL
ncbi:MAG TPA: branched-chain amino acid aminotransferase [Pyrinomonadaceae bacterium]